MSKAEVSEPSASDKLPLSETTDWSPKISGPNVRLATSRLSILIDSGSSGRLKLEDSGDGNPVSGKGLRIKSMRSATSDWMLKRPVNSAVRLQFSFAFSMRSQTPSRSAIVIWPTVASDERSPLRPENWMRRFGAESLLSTKEIKYDFSSSCCCSCAMAGTAKRMKARSARNLVKTPVLCPRRMHSSDRPSGG